MNENIDEHTTPEVVPAQTEQVSIPEEIVRPWSEVSPPRERPRERPRPHGRSIELPTIEGTSRIDYKSMMDRLREAKRQREAEKAR